MVSVQPRGRADGGPRADPVSETAAGPSPARSAGAWATLLGVTLFGALIDLFSKSLAFARIADAPVLVSREAVLAHPPEQLNAALIPAHEPVMVIPYVLEFRLVLNPGAVFGVGPGKRWFFVGFTLLAVCAALWMFAKWTTAKDRWSHAALGLVLAGGLGNLYDRLVHGCVRDFLHPLPNVQLPFGITWPGGETEVWPWVSNVADAWLLIGIGILLVRAWGGEKNGGGQPAAEASA